MAVCEICGCKTDELDFVTGNLNGAEKRMCSFCKKQLSGFSENPGEAQLRWLSAVLSKEVPSRSEATAAALNELAQKSGASASNEVKTSDLNGEFDFKASSKGGTVTTDVDKDRLILELLGRVEKLEKALILMKRKQIIKTIIEIIVPIILGILILIVFFSSGLFDTLSGLYGQFI